MNRKFDLIIFDLDGTLFDTEDTIINSLVGVVNEEGLRKLNDDEINSFIGPPALESFKRYYPELSDAKIDELLKKYRAYYLEKELLKAKLFPGMLDVIKKLKENGYKLALATYKKMNCVTPLFDYFDITKYFDTLRGLIDEGGLSKTEIIKLAMADCKVTDIDRICMIGDTNYDLTGAIDCNINFIGVSYGNGYKELLDKKDKYDKFITIVNKPPEILDYV